MPARPRKGAPATRRRLQDFLTPEQWQCNADHGYFEVVGSMGRRYQIYTDSTSGNIRRLTDIRGRALRYPTRWCCGPVGMGGLELQDGLFWASQKMLIEKDEESFFREALRA